MLLHQSEILLGPGQNQRALEHGDAMLGQASRVQARPRQARERRVVALFFEKFRRLRISLGVMASQPDYLLPEFVKQSMPRIPRVFR